MSLLNTSTLLGFSDIWQNYLGMGTPEKVIIGIVVFALLATILYFLYRILDGVAVIFKGIFWILKSLIFLLVVLGFSIAWVFLIIPFGFFKYRQFKEIVELYKIGIRKLKYFFYPKSKKDIILTKEEIEKKVTQGDKKGQKSIKSQKTKKVEEPKKVSEEKDSIVFHCSNCGTEMPVTMVSLLESGSVGFCEACGQKFKMEGGVPYPVEK